MADLLRKFLFPNMSFCINYEEKTIKPVCRPNCISEHVHHSKHFLGKQSLVCVYHVYENILRTYISEIPDNSGLSDSSLNSNSLTIDVIVDRCYFEKTFVRKEWSLPYPLEEVWSTLQQPTESISPQQRPFAARVAAAAYLASQDPDTIPAYMSISSSNSVSPATHYVSAILSSSEVLIKELSIDSLSELGSRFCCFARVWESASMLYSITIVVEDKAEEKVLIMLCKTDRLLNGNQTFINQQALSKLSVSYETVRAWFGVDAISMSWDEKVLVSKWLVDCMQARVSGRAEIVDQDESEVLSEHYLSGEAEEMSVSLELRPPVVIAKHVCVVGEDQEAVTVEMRMLATRDSPLGISVWVEGTPPHRTLTPRCFLVAHGRRFMV
jgi:hypothetical protein